MKRSRTSPLEGLKQTGFRLEIRRFAREQQIDVQRQRDQLRNGNEDLVAALKIVADYKLMAKMGDWHAILSQSIRSHPAVQHAHFKNYAKVSEIVDELEVEDTEADIARTQSQDPARPLRTSLEKAYSYFKDAFVDIEEMIACLKAYADRNLAFYCGAKEHYDKGNFNGLRMKLIECRQELEGLALEDEEKDRCIKVFEQVKNAFYISFEWDLTADFTLTPLAKTLRTQLLANNPESTKKANLSSSEVKAEKAQKKARETQLQQVDIDQKRLEAESDLSIIERFSSKQDALSDTEQLTMSYAAGRLREFIKDQQAKLEFAEQEVTMTKKMKDDLEKSLESLQAELSRRKASSEKRQEESDDLGLGLFEEAA